MNNKILGCGTAQRYRFHYPLILTTYLIKIQLHYFCLSFKTLTELSDIRKKIGNHLI